MWELDYKESWVPKNLFWTVVLEKTLESPLDCKEIQPVHPKGEQSWIFIGIFWISNTLVSWCKELTHLKRPWCCERLKAGGEGDDRGGDGWMGSPTQWTWVWVNSGSWWWTGRPGVLQSMGSQRVGHDWATELNLFPCIYLCKSCFFSRQFPPSSPLPVRVVAITQGFSQMPLPPWRLSQSPCAFPSRHLIVCGLFLRFIIKVCRYTQKPSTVLRTPSCPSWSFNCYQEWTMCVSTFSFLPWLK